LLVINSDPESDIPFSKVLYSNVKFMQTFFDSLSDDGILAMQLGEAPDWDSADETYSQFKNRAATTRLLEDVGFESIHTYEEVNLTYFPTTLTHNPPFSQYTLNDALQDSLRL